jgi:ABC-2 type transport system ATP-binding protein
VEVVDLVKAFGQFRAVDGISFSVAEGDIFGFLGPNGAGKSTTIKMLTGLLRPTSGKGLVLGFDMSRQNQAIRAAIGYMSQKFSLYDDLKVGENVAFFGGLYGLAGSRLKAAAEWVLNLAALKGQEELLTRTLPAGIKQRLALGCAALHRPRILFLDEPTAGVDPTSRRNFWDFIYHLADQGVTVFVTTHYMDEAEYCRRLAIIMAGRLAALGSPAELKAAHGPQGLVAVEADDPLAALAVLKARPEVREATLFGLTLHAALIGPDPGEAARAALGQAGLAVRSVKPIQPGLEDVFISLVGREGA